MLYPSQKRTLIDIFRIRSMNDLALKVRGKKMQIENHKEEVPFAHYEEKFRALEPASVAERLKGVIAGKA